MTRKQAVEELRRLASTVPTGDPAKLLEKVAGHQDAPALAAALTELGAASLLAAKGPARNDWSGIR